MKINKNEKLLSIDEVAEILGVKKNTLLVWKCNHRYNLPVIKIGRLVRYRLADVEYFIKNNTQQFNNEGGSNEN